MPRKYTLDRLKEEGFELALDATRETAKREFLNDGTTRFFDSVVEFLKPFGLGVDKIHISFVIEDCRLHLTTFNRSDEDFFKRLSLEFNEYKRELFRISYPIPINTFIGYELKKILIDEHRTCPLDVFGRVEKWMLRILLEYVKQANDTFDSRADIIEYAMANNFKFRKNGVKV